VVYSHRWLVTNHIVYSRYTGVLTRDGLRASIGEIYTFLDQNEGSLVHVISDVSEFQKSLTVIETVRIVRERPIHPNRGWSITIGEKNPVMAMVFFITRKLLKSKRASFTNLEEALQFLAEVDPSIDWSRKQDGIVAEMG
jgi:hypothetical protein